TCRSGGGLMFCAVVLPDETGRLLPRTCTTLSATSGGCLMRGAFVVARCCLSPPSCCLPPAVSSPVPTVFTLSLSFVVSGGCLSDAVCSRDLFIGASAACCLSRSVC